MTADNTDGTKGCTASKSPTKKGGEDEIDKTRQNQSAGMRKNSRMGILHLVHAFHVCASSRVEHDDDHAIFTFGTARYTHYTHKHARTGFAASSER